MQNSLQEETPLTPKGAARRPYKPGVALPSRFALFVIVALAAIFVIPYFVPVTASASESYIYGCNNRAGMLLLFFFGSVGAIWTRGMNFPFFSAASSSLASNKLLAAALAAVSLGCLFMYIFAGRFGGFGESFYNIDRVWLLLHGKTPYKDFEFVYGVYFLYLPVILIHALKMSVASATYLAWAISCLCGTACLFGTVNLIDYPTKRRNSIFLLLLCATFPYLLSMGPDPILRHVAPIFFILLIQRLIDKARRQYAALAAISFTAILVLISPEMAVAFVFGCVCILLLDDRYERVNSICLSAAILAAFTLFFLIANHFHELDTMLGFGAGAFDLPLIPAPHILLYFAAAFLCACAVYRRLVSKQGNNNTFCLIACSLPMIPAALSRCDGPHVVLNGLGIFLACLFYVSNFSLAWKWCSVAFLLSLVAIPLITGLRLYTPLFANVFINSLEETGSSGTTNGVVLFIQKNVVPLISADKREKWNARFEALKSHSGSTVPIDLAKLYPEWYGGFAAPFGYRPNRIGSYLSERIDYGFFEGLEDVATSASVAIKIRELERDPQRALLLPDHFDRFCGVNADPNAPWLSFDVDLIHMSRAAHTDSVYQPLCNYIHANYLMAQDATPDDKWHSLWIRKSIIKDRKSIIWQSDGVKMVQPTG